MKEETSAPETLAELQAALKETISRTIISGGKKSEFKRAVAKNLSRQMGKSHSQWKRYRTLEVNNLVDSLWKECLETIADTARNRDISTNTIAESPTNGKA